MKVTFTSLLLRYKDKNKFNFLILFVRKLNELKLNVDNRFKISFLANKPPIDYVLPFMRELYHIVHTPDKGSNRAGIRL